MIWRALIALLGLALPLQAQEPPLESIVSGLSQTRVAITADFEGSEILVYGAIKRDAPAPKGPLDVIVTVEGPSGPVMVRKKERIAGIWINNEAVEVDSAPSFFAVATTRPLNEILSATDDFRHRITIDRSIRAVGIADQAYGHEAFVEALLRVRSEEGRYRALERSIELKEQTLFRADIALPSNLTEGEYRVRLFLLRDNRVIAEQQKMIWVRKEGLERFLFNLAHDMPLIYGLLSLALAVFAGWGASAAFRFIRP